MGALLLLLLCTVKASASQTAVAKWEFSTGYDVEKSGTTATYTPNTLGWSQIANTKWSQTQPYFLPNEPILFAIKTAALAGVDVRVMCPLHSDAQFTDWASRSYLREIHEAGAHVWLYKPGFLHSKLVT